MPILPIFLLLFSIIIVNFHPINSLVKRKSGDGRETKKAAGFFDCFRPGKKQVTGKKQKTMKVTVRLEQTTILHVWMRALEADIVSIFGGGRSDIRAKNYIRMKK